ncbi:MAG: ABC transporter substrate-binding protein [Usitatibacteraceae bacterium]
MSALYTLRRVTLAVLVLALNIAPLAAAIASDIKVGLVLDQAGIEADSARDYIAGARTWFDHVNANGGVKGRRIELIVRDDDGKPARAVTVTRELLDQEKVAALFGYVGDVSLKAVSEHAYFRASKTVLFAPLSGAEIGTGRDAIIFLRPSYKDEVRYAIAHFAQLSVSRFAVVYADNNFGRSLDSEIRTQLMTGKRRPVVEIAIPISLNNIGHIARTVLSENPQVIIVAADTLATAQFVKQVRSQNVGAQIVALSTVNHRTLMEVAKADFAVGTMITQVVPNPLAHSTKLQNDHLALLGKYRDEPPSHLTLEGFLAAKAFVKLLERANSDMTRASIFAASVGAARYDLDGMALSFGGASDRGSRYVDIAYLRSSGKLLQ